MSLAAGVIAALAVGFMAGLLSFKKSEQYCPDHGITKSCAICRHPNAEAPAGGSDDPLG